MGLLRARATVRRSLLRRGDRSQSTGSRWQHHRSPGGGSTKRRWRNTPWRRLGRPGPLVSVSLVQSPGRPRCKAIAADPSTTCRPDTQPLHSASSRRSQSWRRCAPLECLRRTRRSGTCQIGCRQREGPRQMNGPSSARRQHVWRTVDTTPRDTGRAARLSKNYEVPRNGRASQLSPWRCRLPLHVR